MTKLISGYKAIPQLIDLGPNQAIAVKAYRGTEVRSLQGELWVTQEGDNWDYVVPAGTRFCSGNDELIVVSALKNPGRVSVSWRDPDRAGEFDRSAVRLDYGQMERLDRAARRARSDELARLAHAGFRLLARAWRWITRQRRAAGRLATRSKRNLGLAHAQNINLRPTADGTSTSSP